MKNPLAIALLLAPLAILAAADTPSATAPSTQPAPQPAKDLTLTLDAKITIKLLLIPAGQFMMGSPETENLRRTNEIQHQVTLTKPFYMAATPVTVDQFATFAWDTGYQTDAEKEGASPAIQLTNGQLDRSVSENVTGISWRNPSFDQKGDHPAVHISWNDANAFCDWLSKKTGKTVSLPTEAQWEYACRAGTTTAYFWGDNPDDGKGFANCADQSLHKLSPTEPDCFTWDDGFVYTSPVATFKPNAFGLYDMTGNVFQWCLDFYAPYDPNPASDPLGPPTGNAHITRGGSWNNEPLVCRAAFRYLHLPSHRNVDYGFRIIVTTP